MASVIVVVIIFVLLALAWEDGILTVTLDEAAMEELCTVLPFHAGKYPLSAVPLSIVLIPTRITDAEGHVLEVIE